MTPLEVLNAVKSLKTKNCEGHDRIPQRILIDGIQYLLDPLSKIFNKIYNTKTIPEQWLIAKINPIYKMETLKTLKIIGQFQTFALLPKFLKN